MITTVKIAPVERWCEYEKKKQSMKQFAYIDFAAAVGFPIEIFIDSVKKSSMHDCDGMVWLVTPESLQRLCQRTGSIQDFVNIGFCEHLLEMD